MSFVTLIHVGIGLEVRTSHGGPKSRVTRVDISPLL